MSIKKLLSKDNIKKLLLTLIVVALLVLSVKLISDLIFNRAKPPVYQLITTHQGFPLIFNANDRFVGKYLLENKGYATNLDEYYAYFLPTGSTVIDIGSDYGYHTVLFASKAGKFSTIYSIEPRADSMRVAGYNYNLNQVDNVVVLNKLLYSYGSPRYLHAPKYSTMWEVVLDEKAGYVKNKDSLYQVQAHSLDEVIKNVFGVNLMRINGNGTELEIIKGAKSVIEKSPNIGIFLHWNAPLISAYSDISHTTRQLAEIGFNFWLVDEVGNIQTLSEKDLKSLKNGDVIITKKDVQSILK